MGREIRKNCASCKHNRVKYYDRDGDEVNGCVNDEWMLAGCWHREGPNKLKYWEWDGETYDSKAWWEP